MAATIALLRAGLPQRRARTALLRQAAHLQWLERHEQAACAAARALELGACPTAHYLAGTSLIEAGHAAAGIEHLRRARKMIAGGCGLQADSLAGVLQYAIQVAAKQCRAATTWEPRAFWRAELREWTRHLAKLQPEALDAILAIPALDELHMEIRALRALGSNLGLEVQP